MVANRFLQEYDCSGVLGNKASGRNQQGHGKMQEPPTLRFYLDLIPPTGEFSPAVNIG